MYHQKNALKPPLLTEKTAALANDLHRQQLIRTLWNQPMDRETLGYFAAALLSDTDFFARIDLSGHWVRKVSLHPWCPLHAADDVYYIRSVLADTAEEASVEKYGTIPRRKGAKGEKSTCVLVLPTPFPLTEDGYWQTVDIMEQFRAIPEGWSVEFLLYNGKSILTEGEFSENVWL